jgi:uncharacterized protein
VTASKEVLGMLVELQHLEDAMRDMRNTKATLESLQKENAEALEAFDEMLAAQRAQIDETKAFYAEKEAEIKEAEEQTRRSRNRLGSITNQRELTALNKELEIQRRRTTARNEDLLQLMTQMEGAEADLAAKQTARAALEAQMGEVEQALVEKAAAQASHAGVDQGRRDEIRGKLPRQLVSRFDRVSKALGGLAVANVAGGICSGCRMHVMPQIFIQLQRGESLEQCQNCYRMLVLYSNVESAPVAGDDSEVTA